MSAIFSERNDQEARMCLEIGSDFPKHCSINGKAIVDLYEHFPE